MNRDAVLAREPTPGLSSAGADPASRVRRCRSREEPADAAWSYLRAFIAHGAPSVEQIAFQFRVSGEEAEDIRQDALEAMVKSTEPIRAPLAWFWETARRRHCRLVRRMSREQHARPKLRVHEELRRSSVPAPDAGITLREQKQAVEQMLAHVKPSRRPVAALRLAGHNEAEIQAAVDKPIGTVRSMWTRAKEDAGPYWRAVVAAATALLLWLATGFRRGVGSGAGARRRGAGALLACAAVSLAITTDVDPKPPLAADTRAGEEASIVTTVAGWGAFAPPPPPAPNPEREVRTPPPRREAAPTTNQRREPRAVVARAAGSRRSTDEEQTPKAATAPGSTSEVGGDAERDPVVSSSPVSPIRLEAARTHLASVHRAIWVQHDRDAALGLLELYDLTFPDNPFPSKRAELARVLGTP